MSFLIVVRLLHTKKKIKPMIKTNRRGRPSKTKSGTPPPAPPAAQPAAFQWVTPSLILCVAKSRSGKTTLMKYLLGQWVKEGRFDHGVVISQTVETGEWDILPQELLLSRWDPEVVGRFINYHKEHKDKRGFILLDDILGVVNLRDQVFTRLATCGRHFNITVLIVIQQLRGAIPTVIRENCSYLIVFNTDRDQTLKAIHEEYCKSLAPDYEQFRKWFLGNIHSYRALVVDCLNNSPNGAGKFHTIKAPQDPPDFYLDVR